MSDLKVAFIIITTQCSKYFEFDGSIDQQIDILNIINGRSPVVWFDNTLHRKMYRYDDEMEKSIDVFAEKYGNQNNLMPFELRKFMKNIAKDAPFYMFRMGHHLSFVNQEQLTHAVYQLEAIKNALKEDDLWNKEKDDIKALFNDYEIETLGIERKSIGDNTNNRICRFCGRTITDGASFSKNAHAISEALGNKNLLCNEECDDCNERLKNIEDNLSVAYLEIRRALFEVKGKEGVNSVDGQNFIYDAKEKQLVLGQNSHIEEDGDKVIIRLEGRNIFTFQGLYKALVKYVIDLVDGKYLPRFHNTIDWINGILYATELPPIRQYSCNSVHKHPILELFLRKKEHDIAPGPYCFANLFVCNLCLQFVVPFVDVDCGKMKNATQIHPFEKKMEATLAIYNWESEWLDGADTTQRTAWIELEYDKNDTKPSNREIRVSENLKMKPPKYEADTMSFPKFNPSNILSSQTIHCKVSNINTSIHITEEWLQDTSNTIVYNLVVDKDASKILADIEIELCNTDNTEHLLDMKATKEFAIKRISDIFCEESNGHASLQREFALFVTAQTLVTLNPFLCTMHPMINVSKLNLEIICNNLNCILGSW